VDLGSPINAQLLGVFRLKEKENDSLCVSGTYYICDFGDKVDGLHPPRFCLLNTCLPCRKVEQREEIFFLDLFEGYIIRRKNKFR